MPVEAAVECLTDIAALVERAMAHADRCGETLVAAHLAQAATCVEKRLAALRDGRG